LEENVKTNEIYIHKVSLKFYKVLSECGELGYSMGKPVSELKFPGPAQVMLPADFTKANTDQIKALNIGE
jgi:hypothetical protein